MTEKWKPVQFLGLLSRKEVAPEREGEQEAGVCLRSLFEALGASSTLWEGVYTWGKEPGKLGEPMQEKELLFLEERSMFGFWATDEDEGGS